jgi:tRNA(Arg) A34 adenosine deaminase TadA
MMTPEDLTPTEHLALDAAITRALSAWREHGRTGIAAAIVFRDTIVTTAENQVHQDHDPTQHAEIVAIAKAAEVLSPQELSTCTLISTLQPCEMCLSAIRFTGIGRIVFAARQGSVAAKYFVFPKLTIDDFHAAGTPFQYFGGIREDEVIHLYATGEE